MGILRSAKGFFRRNPALELLVGIGICTAAITPVWMLAGKYPEAKLPPLQDSSEKDMEWLKFKLFKEKYFQVQENEKLMLSFLMQECEKPRKKTPLRNQESEASSSRKP